MTTYRVLDVRTGRPIVVQVPQTRVQVQVPPPKVIYPPENPVTSFWVPMLTLIFTGIAAATGGVAAWVAIQTYKEFQRERSRRPDLQLSFPEFQTEKVIAVGAFQLAGLAERLYVQNLGNRDGTNVQIVLTVPGTFRTVGEYNDLSRVVGGTFDTREAAHAAGHYFLEPARQPQSTRADTYRLQAPVTPAAPSEAGQLNAYVPPGVHHIRYRIYCTETGAVAFAGDLLVSAEN